jgi:glutathione S-transferase
MMLKLFYAANTCALASHIALEEAGAEYETVRLSFATSDQRKPEYLALNPKGRVPALVTDDGVLPYARPCMSRTRTECAATAGPTSPRQSRR